MRGGTPTRRGRPRHEATAGRKDACGPKVGETRSTWLIAMQDYPDSFFNPPLGAADVLSDKFSATARPAAKDGQQTAEAEQSCGERFGDDLYRGDGGAASERGGQIQGQFVYA